MAGWEWGQPTAPMATNRLRGCSRIGSSRFPPAHDVSDRLSLSLCCRELLGKAIDSVAEKVCDTDAVRTSITFTKKQLVQPRRIGTRWRIQERGGPGKHSHHLWVWLGQCYHTEGGNAAESSSPEREREPSDAAIGIRSSWGAPKETVGVPHSAEVPPAAECLRGEELHLGKPSPLSSNHLCFFILHQTQRRPGCRDERQIAADAEGPRHVMQVYYATPRWSCPHKKNMKHPRKLPLRTECPGM